MNTDTLCMGCMKEIGDLKQCPHCGFLADTPQIAPYLPLRTQLGGHYLVGKMISAGGDGATYMGWDYARKAAVTIREFLPEEHITRAAGETEVRVVRGSELLFHDGLSAFLNLWRNLARVRSLTALIPVLDIIEENGTAYAVSEHVETISLRDFLLKSRTGYLTFEQTKTLLMPVVSTVSKLHSMGIYHCGISPNTLRLGRDDKIRITDFMITDARVMNSGFAAELDPGYAAIEQYSREGSIGSWTDVYAFGAVTYRMLVGSTPQEAVQRVANDKLMFPAKFAEILPAYAISAVQSAMAIAPDDRTETIDEYREELSGSPKVMVSRQSAAEEAVRAQTTDAEDETVTSGEQELVDVPNFAGQSYTRISSDTVLNERFHFVVEYAYSSTVENGFIISQGTPEGQRVPKGSDLKIVVSKGIEYVTLPDVSGMTYDAAVQLLISKGFTCTKVEKENDGTHTAGIVIATTPEPNKDYEKGKEIFLQVWGEEPTTEGSVLGDLMPNLFG